MNSVVLPDQSALSFSEVLLNCYTVADASFAYAAPSSLVPYTNRPFVHQRRCTKRLITSHVESTMRHALLKRAKNFLTNAAPAATKAAGAAAPQVGDRRRRQVPGRSRRASGVTRVLSGSAVHETRRIFPSPFISKASRRARFFILSESPAFTAVCCYRPH